MNNTTITIESFEELITKMETMKFSAQWKVTSDIGPNWIGSSRKVDFYLDDCTLYETKFIEKLKDRLIKVIPIPNKSKDHVINGYGDITLEGKQLEIYYEWEATIPYDYPSKSEEGKTLFYP